MNKNTTNMIAIDDDVRKRIVELVLGEQVNVKSEEEAEFKAAFAKMLEDFTEREITHVLDVVSGKEKEDEIFRILIRRMRHPLRTKRLRELMDLAHMISANKGKKMNVKIIGIGGGGVNIVGHLQKMDGFSGECILMDTHIRSLQSNNAPKKVQLGKHITEGRGAANPLTGIDSAVDNLDEIREVISGADVIFIVASMGGGTGTAVAPIVAREAAKQGIVTIGLASLPFDFEGKKRKHRAEIGIELLEEQLAYLRIYQNERVLGKELLDSILEEFENSDHAQAGIIKDMVDNIDEFIGNNTKVKAMILDIDVIRQHFSGAEKKQ